MSDQIEIQADAPTIFTLKLQEFDKKITEAEALAAEFKKQKAAFVYDSNVQMLINQHKAKTQAQPGA